MSTKPKMFIFLVLALLVLMTSGCGGGDDKQVPESNQTITQTKAMVPGSVTENDLAEATDSDSALDVRPEGYGAESTAHPADRNNPAVKPSAEGGQSPDGAIPEQKPTDAPPPPPATKISGPFSLQLGSYTVKAIAEEKAADLRKLGHSATIEEAAVGGQLYYRVFIRGLADRPSAKNLGEDLHKSLGLSYLIKRK
ncbi:MAG: SPOR domain-containing protein [bacterium]|nr:SPOR domain-containing protein [bacterium]